MRSTQTTDAVRVATIPFAPAVRWNMRSHLLIIDLVALVTVLVVYTIATMIPWGGADFVFGIHDLLILTAFAISAVFVLAACDQYDGRCVFSLRRDLSLLLPAVLAGGLTAFAASLFIKFVVVPPYGIASQLLVAGLVSMTCVLIAARTGTHMARSWKPASMHTQDRVLVLGDSERADQLTDMLTNSEATNAAAPTHAIIDNPAAVSLEHDLVARLEREQPTSIVLAFDNACAEIQAVALREAVSRDIPVHVLTDVDPAADALIANGVAPHEAFVGMRERRWQWYTKLVLDRVLAFVLLVVFAPVMLGVVIMIKLSDRGPVFYRQPRLGMYGCTFGVWKFRSMRVDADERLTELLETDPDAKTEWDAYQKLERDPRITRIGSFLRKWSIDELPQLINVLTGQMSIVGPRPPMVDQVDSYGARFVFAHARPGITGLWQVSGRNELTFDERVALDVRYVTEWSLWQDLKILAKTVPVVFGRGGAG